MATDTVTKIDFNSICYVSLLTVMLKDFGECFFSRNSIFRIGFVWVFECVIFLELYMQIYYPFLKTNLLFLILLQINYIQWSSMWWLYLKEVSGESCQNIRQKLQKAVLIYIWARNLSFICQPRNCVLISKDTAGSFLSPPGPTFVRLECFPALPSSQTWGLPLNSCGDSLYVAITE